MRMIWAAGIIILATYPVCGQQIANHENGGNYNELYQKASSGDSDAQLALAHMFLFGIGVPKSENGALQWFHRAAESGSAEAELQLARIYESGSSSVRDSDEAAYWYKKASKHGNQIASAHLQRYERKDFLINPNSKIGFKGDPFWLLLIMLGLAFVMLIGAIASRG